MKLKSVKANGRYTINVTAVSNSSVINFCSARENIDVPSTISSLSS